MGQSGLCALLVRLFGSLLRRAAQFRDSAPASGNDGKPTRARVDALTPKETRLCCLGPCDRLPCGSQSSRSLQAVRLEPSGGPSCFCPIERRLRHDNERVLPRSPRDQSRPLHCTRRLCSGRRCFFLQCICVGQRDFWEQPPFNVDQPTIPLPRSHESATHAMALQNAHWPRRRNALEGSGTHFPQTLGRVLWAQ